MEELYFTRCLFLVTCFILETEVSFALSSEASSLRIILLNPFKKGEGDDLFCYRVSSFPLHVMASIGRNRKPLFLMNSFLLFSISEDV